MVTRRQLLKRLRLFGYNGVHVVMFNDGEVDSWLAADLSDLRTRALRELVKYEYENGEPL